MENTNKKVFTYTLTYSPEKEMFEIKSYYQGMSYEDLIMAMSAMYNKVGDIMRLIVESKLNTEECKDTQNIAELYTTIENDILEFSRKANKTEVKPDNEKH